LKQEAPSLLALAAAALISLAAYPWLPNRIPVHWGIDGAADTYASRHWAVLLNPAGMLLVYFFFLFVRYGEKTKTSRLTELGLFEPLRHGAVIFFGFTHALAIGSGLNLISKDLNFLAAGSSFLLLLFGISLRCMGNPGAVRQPDDPTYARSPFTLEKVLRTFVDRCLRGLRVAPSGAGRSSFAWIPVFTGVAGLVGACVGRRHWLWALMVAAIGAVLLRHRYGGGR